MPKPKPWFHVVTPREDLRENRPIDASEFAVNLDHIREGKAPRDYQEPARFFERTYPTRNLKDLAAQTVRRLSGITVETSPVFNMATQFGGGKTHTLALLYHLAEGGPKSHEWQGVSTDPRPGPGQGGAQGGDGRLRRPEVRFTDRPRRNGWRAETANTLGRDRLAARRAEGVLGRRPARRGGDRTGRRRDPRVPARRTDPHPDGRAAQLRQPRAAQKIRPGHPALQFPPESLRGGPRAIERRPLRLDSGLRAGDDPRGPPRLRVAEEAARPAGQGRHHVGRERDLPRSSAAASSTGAGFPTRPRQPPRPTPTG